MGKPDLGVKQQCPNCDARFFDLNKRPAVCPKCKTAFDPDTVKPSRRATPVAQPEPEEAEDETEEAVEAEIPPVDSPDAAEPLPEGDGDGDDEPAGDDEEEVLTEEVEEEAEALEGESGDVPFLEDDEDEEFESDDFEDGEEEEGT
jgi:uncharacterized protein (TIGR02300 family)